LPNAKYIAGWIAERGHPQVSLDLIFGSWAEAPPAVKRQVFESFDLRIAYDKAQHRVELTATVSEAVADAFENAKALQLEGSGVVVTDIAGVGFEPTTSGL
jgi:hypothetical protein